MSTWRLLRGVGSIGLVAAAFGDPPDAEAEEIPAFARRYHVSCSLCHNPVPKLTEFGETFAGNGFRFASEEPPRDTIATGDPLLDLPADLPLAIRFDGYAQAFTDGETATDFEAPYNLKLLSGGTLSKNISYYLYFFLFERGEIAGIEDAFIYVNDIAHQPVDAAVGQFQVSDPLFKRELRLEFDDYAVYRARLGDQPADLTYDRGAMVIADYGGFTVTGMAVNGNGKGPAQENRRFDDDPVKNFMGRVSREVLTGVRLGAMGYYGRQRLPDEPGSRANTLWMGGADGTFSVGPFELNGQYIHREDDAPTFTPGERRAVMDGGFGEAIVRPRRSRWYGYALYNLVHANRPVLDVRLGGPSNITRYQTASAGVGYLVRRNFRVGAEGMWDFEEDSGRWTLGIVTAF